VSTQPEGTGQPPDRSATTTNPRAGALGYTSAIVLAQAAAVAVGAATLDPSPSLLWALGGVLGGLETITGVFALLRLKSIQQHERDLARMRYTYEERKRLQEALWTPRRTSQKATTEHRGPRSDQQ
jgi:hypothetical protein